MDFDETKQEAAVMELDLALAAGAQQLPPHQHLQSTDQEHRPHQIHEPLVPDAACNYLTPFLLPWRSVTTDGAPKSCIKSTFSPDSPPPPIREVSELPRGGQLLARPKP